MTLAELYYQVKENGGMFNTWAIPMKKNGKDYNVKFSCEKDENEQWFINVKEE